MAKKQQQDSLMEASEKTLKHVAGHYVKGGI